ncbi:arylsulfatase B-like [Haliotis rubra]|uniref:arylsulfatase B-like n=1 Tax=Haliotis rubra TaxID=36100 RepID=UPI001EE58547|nr:arylsulfatase B-like [Haliotis rubra]
MVGVRLLLALFLFSLSLSSTQRPNIVFIVADDLVWNDLGFRNPDMITPNIDKLATQGIIFNNAYVQPLCSPSRTAFMSGMYPFHAGMQWECTPTYRGFDTFFGYYNSGEDYFSHSSSAYYAYCMVV